MLSKIKKWLSFPSKKRKAQLEKRQDHHDHHHNNNSRRQHVDRPQPSTGSMVADKRIPIIFTKDCGYVPAVLVNAGEVIEKHITTKNLFQVQGSTVKVKQLMSILSLQKMPKLRRVHVHDVVEVIKVGLCRLAKELIPARVMDLLIEANQSRMDDYTAILTLFHRTSPLTFAAVHYVMRLLNKVIQNSESNGMDARKLATIFVLDILKPLTSHDHDDSQEYEALRLQRVERLPYLIMVIEQLILKVSAFKHATAGNDAKIKSSYNVENTHDKPSKYATHGDAPEARCGDLDFTADELLHTCPRRHCQMPTSSTHSPFSCCDADGTREDCCHQPDAGKDDNGPATPASLSTTGRASLSRKSSYLQGGGRSGGGGGGMSNKSKLPISKPGLEPHQQQSKGSSDLKPKKGGGGGKMSLTFLKSKLKKKSPTKSRVAFRSKGVVPKCAHKEEPNAKSTAKIGGKPPSSQKKKKIGKVQQESGGALVNASVEGKTLNGPPFHNDEELMPWTGQHTDSDDSSIMNRTIQQPRFYKSRIASGGSSYLKFPLGSEELLFTDDNSRHGSVDSHSAKLYRSPSLAARSSPGQNDDPASLSNDALRGKLPNDDHQDLISSRHSLLRRVDDDGFGARYAYPGSLKRPRSRTDLGESISLKRPSPRSFRKQMIHPFVKSRHATATFVKPRCLAALRSNKFLEWSTDVVLLLMALFCVYLLFLLMQKHNPMFVAYSITSSQKKLFGLS